MTTGGNIIGLNSASARGAASASDLEALYNYLINTLGQDFVINGYGDALGPSASRPWTLTGTGSVTEYVQSGGVFIDYCAWPMEYQIQPDGTVNNPGPSGFQSFATALGYGWLSDASFAAVAKSSGPNGYLYPFPRGYVQSGSVNGLYLPHGTFTDQGTWALNGSGYAAMLGLHRPGEGWYFYGVHWETLVRSIFNMTLPATVPVNVYGAFIERCVHNQTSASGSNFSLTISHEPYTVPKTAPQKNTTGPSNPYGLSSSPGPSGQTSAGGNGSSNNTNNGTNNLSTCPNGYRFVNGQCVKSSGPSTGTLIAGGAIVAGATVIGIIGYKGGWFSWHQKTAAAPEEA